MKIPTLLASILIVFSINVSCNNTARIYRWDDKKRYLVGNLTEPGYNALKQVLLTYSKSELKDTLIIKYDYNRETCWDLLDQHGDDYIHGVVSAQQMHIQKAGLNRKGVPIFSFREEGNDFNKLKKWDNTLIIDKEAKLFRLLFYERTICGSSIIVLPDRKYVLLRSDSHFEILDYSGEKIRQLLLP
ncbi:MAG TPA: hypothetical protein VK498_10360 [Ferruginibacter sp.]|nr:hypothetical protein [Ferruginibacter sp.]